MINKDKEIRVALVGAYPPPYGGVSVHIERLRALCLNNNLRCTVFDTSPYSKTIEGVISLRKIKNWLHFLNCRYDIIHIHSSGLHLMTLILFFALFKFRGAKFILTFHSFRDDLKHAKPLRRKIMNISLRLASHCIAANLEIKEKLVSLGARPENISVLPAFLPPSIEEREIKRIPQKVWDFIDNHTPIITVNAFKIVFYQDQDLYGLDLCVELCASLHNDYPKVGLVFCLPEIGDYEYFNKMKQRIAEEGIEDNFLLVTQPYQFYPILMKSHVFIRPTNTDGDATSLREALFFKVPSVASDVCPRPEGTILFKNRDINDLTQKVRELLNNYEPRKKELDLVKIEDNSMKLVEVYQNLMNLKG